MDINKNLPITVAHEGIDDKYRKWNTPRSVKQDKSDMPSARPFHTCGYCGSMHPTELAEALAAGAHLEMADQKYGWPHKFYVDGAPNRFAGEMEIRSGRQEAGVFTPGPAEPAKATAYGKFYTVHLLDATPEEKLILELRMGFHLDVRMEEVCGTPQQRLYARRLQPEEYNRQQMEAATALPAVTTTVTL
jgi:hypothetical protein